jgi:mRNA-degrading endonuclease toxin of MazEF toxin-antitoxin module
MEEDNLSPDEDIYVTDYEPKEGKLKEGKGKAIKVSPFVIISYLSVTVILARTDKNPRKATSAEISTMPAPIRLSQEIPPLILLPK